MPKLFKTLRKYDNWTACNCPGCTHNIGTVPGSGCGLRVALDVAAANGGDVSDEVAERCGWWGLDKWFWTCGERERAEAPHAD